MDIVAYCNHELVQEPLEYREKLWDIYVQDGVTFLDWLYCNQGAGSDDDRRRLMEALSKREMIPQSADPAVCEPDVRTISITLGSFGDCVSNMQEYIQARRAILASIRNVKEYEAFMQSCFTNSIFAEGILSEMKHIQRFSEKTVEITSALGILNDHAVTLYQQYSHNLEEAMRILAVLLHRECAPDPGHAESLVFSFTYREQLEGTTVAKVKQIECSPHLKLIHPGSNLRIYFYWCDETVGAGEQVLVGRIGRHPY